MREVEQLKTKKPPGYFDRFIIDNNDVKESDSTKGRIVYFNFGEENINLGGWNIIAFGCLEGEKYLRAIFYKSEYKATAVHDSDSVFQEAVVVRALYKNDLYIHWKKFLEHMKEILKFELNAVNSSLMVFAPNLINQSF